MSPVLILLVNLCKDLRKIHHWLHPQLLGSRFGTVVVVNDNIPGGRKDSSGPYPAALEALFLALCSKDHMLCWGFELGWATCKTSAISPVQDNLSSPKRTFFFQTLKNQSPGLVEGGLESMQGLGCHHWVQECLIPQRQSNTRHEPPLAPKEN